MTRATFFPTAGRDTANTADRIPTSVTAVTQWEESKNSETVIEQIIDDRTVAFLIDSEILGAPIWFALRDGWRPDDGDGVPTFYASELPALRAKTAEQLRSIFNIKRAFGGGRVKQ